MALTIAAVLGSLTAGCGKTMGFAPSFGPASTGFGAAPSGTARAHPWQMFLGTYEHKASSSVNGPRSASLKWRVDVRGSSSIKYGGNSLAISADGTLYVAGANKLFALDRSGNQKWVNEYPGGVQGPALSNDGSTLYFLLGSAIIALDTAGAEKGRYVTGGDVLFGPTVAPDGSIYQGSWDGYVYCLNPDGTLKWRFLTGGCVSYPITVGKDGRAYVGGGDAHCGADSNVYVIDSSGALQWTFNTGQLRVGAPTFAPDETLLISASPVLFNLTGAGAQRWSMGSINGPAVGIQTTAVWPGGIGFTGHSDGKIRAIDLASQTVKWSYATGSDPAQAGFTGIIGFPIADASGNVFAGSVDNRMYALDKNGNLLWSYLTGGRISEASPALDSDGTLYFTSEDGYLYAIGAGG